MIVRRALASLALVPLAACSASHPEALARTGVAPVKTVPSRTFPSSHVSNTFPADLVPRRDPRCAHIPLSPGWVQRENRRTGLASWEPRRRRRIPPAQLYVDDPSLTCGDLLSVRLGGNGGNDVRIRVIRIGWYGGAGAREVWTSPPLVVAPAVEPQFQARAVPAAGWLTHVTTPVAPSWTPGLYLAEAVQDDEAVGAAAFVVRNDAKQSPLVVVHSNLTWEAYSNSGGANLYLGPAKPHAAHTVRYAARAYVVSMLRPTTGTGLIHVLAADVPLAELTDELGLPVDHVLDTDLAIRPSVLLGHAGIVLPGHSEYWTLRAYDAVRIERDRGVNLLDLGGNTIYWQARVSSDRSGRPLTMTVYREASLDPEAAVHPDLTTVRWQSPFLRRPPSALLGESFAAAGATGGLVVHAPPAWLVSGTTIRDGDRLPYAVMNEADGAQYDDTAAPANVQVVTEGVLRGDHARVVSSSYYSDPSGAAVFDAGVTRWLCEAMNTCPERQIPDRTSLVIRELTARLLWAFSHPRWGATHPSHRDVPPPPNVLRKLLPDEAIGTYGHEKS